MINEIWSDIGRILGLLFAIVTMPLWLMLWPIVGHAIWTVLVLGGKSPK